MVILILGMVIALLVHDTAGPSRALDAEFSMQGVLATLSGQCVALLLFAWYCRQTRRTLGTGPGKRWYRRLGRVQTLWPPLLLGLFIVQLWTGGLIVSRRVLGDGVLYDELVVMLPTLVAVMLGWWLYYPIDRRLRDAALFRRADRGLPISPTWTRAQYLLMQLRHQLLIVLLPLLVIMGWSESLDALASRGLLAAGVLPWLVPIGAGVVFFVAPVGLRHVFDTAPMPAGTIRDAMLTLCRQHNLRLRELLLWRTHGGVANAAVMGLAGPVRYVMLTDALLDQTPRPMVEAVMAHELGHVRHKHLFTLLLAAIASLAALSALWGLASLAVASPGEPLWWGWEALVTVGVFACWFPLIGWVSRQVERQADVFAVRHLQTHHFHGWKLNDLAEPVFEHPAVQTMVHALLHLATLNHIDTAHHDWRHGSIAARARYLRSLTGRPMQALGVDATVRGIQFASALILLLIGIATLLGH